MDRIHIPSLKCLYKRCEDVDVFDITSVFSVPAVPVERLSIPGGMLQYLAIPSFQRELFSSFLPSMTIRSDDCAENPRRRFPDS